MAADLAMDIWLRAHDEFGSTFQKFGAQAEGLRGKIGLLAHGVGVLAEGMGLLTGGVLGDTMKDFVQGGKRAIAIAGLYRVPLSQVMAQLAVLSEHGFPSAQMAGLNWAGMLHRIERPLERQGILVARLDGLLS